MCNPDLLTMGELAATGLKAGTQVAQSRYEQAAARTNEAAARREAQMYREAGAEQYSAELQMGRQVAGKQAAGLGASGLDTQGGSALDLLSDTAYLSALDAATTLKNANRRADALEGEANAQKEGRKFLRSQTPFAVGGTLLTGGSRAYGIYKGLNNYGRLTALRGE
jgi:hypothetical protein